MEIIPNKGIGPIQFGMTPHEVKSIMGEELVYEEWMGGNLNDTLYYSGIVLCFDKHNEYGPVEDGHLIEIWIDESFNAVYKGIPPFNLKQEVIEQLLKSEGAIYTTRGSGDSVGIYVEAYHLEFAFEKTNLVQISLFAPR